MTEMTETYLVLANLGLNRIKHSLQSMIKSILLMLENKYTDWFFCIFSAKKKPLKIFSLTFSEEKKRKYCNFLVTEEEEKTRK